MKSQLLVLVGLRCVGKSSLGSALAKQWGWQFLDLDCTLAERGGSEPLEEVGQLLVQLGLESFRDAEERLLAETLSTLTTPCVLATGGGVVERAANRALLGAQSCLWIDVPLASLVARAAKDSSTRPSLTGKAPAEEFRELFARRAPWYEEVAGSALELGNRNTEDALALLDRHGRQRFEHFQQG